jgi:hypothetical protein
MAINMYWSGNPKKPTERQRLLIRALRHAIPNGRRPIAAVERVIREVLNVPGADAHEYLEAARAAIQDEESLTVDESRESRSDVLLFFQEIERILSQ